MNKLIAIAAVMAFIIGIGMIIAPLAYAANPLLTGIQRPLNYYEETIIGGNPQTVDYSWAYDTASGQIIQNCMDTLVQFNGEHTDQYLPDIATSWTGYALNGGLGINSGLPISGLVFENGAQPGPNAIYYYQYDFKIRTGVFFQPPYNYSVTPQDIVYSFQRTLIQDRTSGPQWMLEEPLLDINGGSLDNTISGMGITFGNATQEAEMGALIENAVTTNGTDVFFNLMFPGGYLPSFYQIMSQTWSSIESQQWVDSYVIGTVGNPDWPGYANNNAWASLTAWVTFHNPAHSPLDYPTQLLCYGSGPFIMSAYDTANFWSGVRYEGYWGGWPASFPNLGGATPAGYVDSFTVNFNTPYATRLTDFKSGAADFIALDSDADIPDLFAPGQTPPYTEPNYPIPGIREIYPETLLEYDAVFFTFNMAYPAIDTYEGNVYAPDSGLHSDGIPANFFTDAGIAGHPEYGTDIRQAFAEVFNYSAYLAQVWLTNFASEPITAIVPGLPENNASIVGYSTGTGLPSTLNPNPLQDANASFNAVPGLATTGFSLLLEWNTGNVARQDACLLLAASINSLNPNYHVTVSAGGIPWGDYLYAAVFQGLAAFVIGWLADYPDGYDFALPTYHTGGAFASWQLYSNSTVDAWINDAATTNNPTQRQNDYNNIQIAAIQNVPSFTIDQPLGVHFEQDWNVGWYYNTVYPGEYFYNMWKWYYVPEANAGSKTQPQSSNLPADVNYDGIVNIKDISAVAKAFLTSYTIFGLSPRWVFRGDVNNDRHIDIKDISYVAKLFNQKSPLWPLYDQELNVSVNGGPWKIYTSGQEIVTTPGASIAMVPILTNSTGWPLPPITQTDWQISTWPGPLASIATTPTYTFLAGAGPVYYLHVDLGYTVPFPAGATPDTCTISVSIDV